MEIKNKRGWVRILEATISVMIISGALLAVYSKQPYVKESREDYYYSLQEQILSDISLHSDLRSDVLLVKNDTPSDSNFTVIDNFVKSKVPASVNYSIRICDLNITTDYCRMKNDVYISVHDKDIFVDDVIISAEVGDGENPVYYPKKVRLFFWEA